MSYFTNITVHPQSSILLSTQQLVLLVNQADNGDIVFLVDSTLGLAADVINRGFTQQHVEDLSNGKWRRVLLAKAFEDNNNTNISCRAIDSQAVCNDICKVS